MFEGNVDGQLVVARSLLNPTLGGEIRLSQGKIQLVEPAALPAGDPGSQSNPGLEFDNLKLTLGDRMRLVRELLLNFVASGTITINGSAEDPQPVGVISLRSGQVNLFTTQFNLDRGYPQTATFEPRYGLDPFLDVRLVTTAAEVTQSRLPSTANSAEILDASAFNTNIGSLQTIRVQAKAYGLASQISENLVLTSSPPRSESEIVSLIGGGFINTFVSGEPTAGLANLAGSVLLTNFQNFISRTLGLTQFRIFPAFVPQTTRDRDGNE
ncbi:MAG TPA: translocation/assembly module TamB domain-containing protein, partial [Coleofasciculaceae cyanobacterium]